MRILAIETSCDETAVAILEASGTLSDATFAVLGNALYSQATRHAAYGGVYPSLAKREHAANLVPLYRAALQESRIETGDLTPSGTEIAFLDELLVREPELRDALVDELTLGKPTIDLIAVTSGPGLEPALWVGINFARALAHLFHLPILTVNHLEGHLVASAVSVASGRNLFTLDAIQFPLLGLIVSGGHTEFVGSDAWGTYARLGGTRDDSVGEAFDKVARLLALPYPGAPELSRMAARGRALPPETRQALAGDPFPRPMEHSGDLDFSFSGLKTAVLYRVRALGDLTDDAKAAIAAAFEDAAVDVLLAKTLQALDRYPVPTLLLGGGVSANTYLRERLSARVRDVRPDLTLRLPAPGLSTDNAIMIGMAAYLGHCTGAPTHAATDPLRADGNLPLTSPTR